MARALGPFPVTAGSLVLHVAPLRVPAGFPSPAQDYYDGPIDLTEALVKDRAATFIVRVCGDSMEGAGISDGDELLVDRSLEPRAGDVVVAVLDGELTVKRLDIPQTERGGGAGQGGRGGVLLRAENPKYPDIAVGDASELVVWGVATYCIHHLRRAGGRGR